LETTLSYIRQVVIVWRIGCQETDLDEQADSLGPAWINAPDIAISVKAEAAEPERRSMWL